MFVTVMNFFSCSLYLFNYFFNLFISSAFDDYDAIAIPQNVTFSSQSPRQCIRIRTFQNTDTTATILEVFLIMVTPINSTSTGTQPVLSSGQVMVRLFEVCVDRDLRLVNGLDESQGHVEVCWNGAFVSICDMSNWTPVDSTTVCRQLGFSGQGRLWFLLP